MTPTRLLAACLVALAVVRPAAAQHTWNGSGGNGNWSTAANWSGGVPASSAATALTFAGTAQLVTTQDITSPFLLNGLTFAAGAGSFSVGGGALEFRANGATAPTLTLDATNYAAVSSAVTLAAQLTIRGATTGTGGPGYDLVLAGRLTGAGGLTVNFTNGFATAVLASAENGYTGPTTVSGGVLVLGGVNAVGRTSAVTVNDVLALNPGQTARGVTAGDYDQRVGSLAGTTSAAAVDLGSARLTVGFDSSSTTFAGNVFGTGRLVKVGGGVQTLTGANGYSGATVVEGGGLTLGGTGGTAIASGSVSVAAGATLTLDNAAVVANRLGNTAAVTLRGGTFALAGRAGTATAEVAGNLSLTVGQSAISVTPGSGAGATLTFARLLGANGTAVVTGPGLGEAAGAGVANVFFTTAPTLLGGSGAAGTTTISLAPTLLAAGGEAGDALTPVTYSATTGVRPLKAAEFAASLASGNAADNVRLTAAASAVAANTTRNSLLMAASGQDLSVSSGNTLTLSSGVLVSGGGDATTTQTSQVSGAGAVAFGAGGTRRAYVTVSGAEDTLAVATPLQSAGLVKSGAGTLALANTATLGTGAVVVNAGTLRVAGAAPLAGVGAVVVSAGAVLDVSAVGTGLSLTSGQTLSGSGAVLGSIRVGNEASVAPMRSPGPGTLVVGSATFDGGGAYDWQLNSVTGGAFTHSLLSGSGPLDLTGLTAANRFTVRVTSLTADNALGPVSDFDPTRAYAWTIATFAGGISGFDAGTFAVDASGFAGADAGVFAVGRAGNDLFLTFTPVPEPIGLLGVAATALLARRFPFRLPRVPRPSTAN